MTKLLNFLSSAEALQELVIDGDTLCWNRDFQASEDFGYPDGISAPIVTMPSVVSCDILHEKRGPIWVGKLRMPMLRTLRLKLHGFRTLSCYTQKKFCISMPLLTSLEDLELKDDLLDIDDIDKIVRYAPPHLESFSLKGCRKFLTDMESWNNSPIPRRTLIRFESCSGIFTKFMPAFVRYLRTVELGGMKLQFTDCALCRDGTFGLDDVMSARVIA